MVAFRSWALEDVPRDRNVVLLLQQLRRLDHFGVDLQAVVPVAVVATPVVEGVEVGVRADLVYSKRLPIVSSVGKRIARMMNSAIPRPIPSAATTRNEATTSTVEAIATDSTASAAVSTHGDAGRTLEAPRDRFQHGRWYEGRCANGLGDRLQRGDHRTAAGWCRRVQEPGDVVPRT
jgi:hypothetical protein